VAFCDPTLRDEAPEGSAWVHEIKTDGYRAQLHLRAGTATVYSRRGHDWTVPFAAIAAAARELPAREAILDGEAAVLGRTGLPDFQALRRELGRPDSTRLIYHAFDLLYLDGTDLRPAALTDRKRLLRDLLQGAPPALLYVDHLAAEGAQVLAHACRMGLEGIVSKQARSRYRSGRQESWVKLKCVRSDTFPIVAFVEKLGARPRRIASLYLGRREGARLLYAGKARSGYTQTVARQLRERLDPLILARSPLSVQVRKPKATWVEPVVLAEIEHAGFTDDGLLRAAVFKGLREDLEPAPARTPRRAHSPAGKTRGVPRENILQLLPEAVVPSREELIGYWRRVAPKALPHLGGRPLKLVRHSHGITFYHKGPLPEVPPALHQLRIRKREGGEGVRLWVDDLAGLIGLVEIGAVELHPWNARRQNIEHADRMVIDLDPGEGVSWPLMIETALELRDLLRLASLESWPKLTGGKGIHVMVAASRPHPARPRPPPSPCAGAAAGHTKPRPLCAVRGVRSARAHLPRLSAERARHDGGRGLLAASASADADRRAGELASDRAGSSSRRLHHRQPVPSGPAGSGLIARAGPRGPLRDRMASDPGGAAADGGAHRTQHHALR
jgi:bifunctional non-homologous end joining protein LigD